MPNKIKKFRTNISYVKIIWAFILLPWMVDGCLLESNTDPFTDWVNSFHMREANTLGIPDSMKTRYIEDAGRLALREMVKQDSSRIVVPNPVIDFFYHALAHFHNSSFKDRNLLVETYKVHTFPNPATHTLILTIDTSASWVKDWKAGTQFTGIAGIDGLISSYNLSLVDKKLQNDRFISVLESAHPLNIRALARRFTPIKHVQKAEPAVTSGDGNDIRGVVKKEYVDLNFSVGYGGCHTVCNHRSIWKFRIHNDGLVDYIGHLGDPPPATD